VGLCLGVFKPCFSASKSGRTTQALYTLPLDTNLYNTLGRLHIHVGKLKISAFSMCYMSAVTTGSGVPGSLLAGLLESSQIFASFLDST
jgi:hypothetical protein